MCSMCTKGLTTGKPSFAHTIITVERKNAVEDIKPKAQ